MGHIRNITTKKGTRLQFWFNSEGAVEWSGAKTLKRFHELEGDHPNLEEFGVWCAFSNAQFEEGMAKAIAAGKMKEGEKVYQFQSGVYGTERNLTLLHNHYQMNRNRIAEECDPQEVYFYEYNNYECCYSWDGDIEALEHVKSIFGDGVVKDIIRI